MNCAGKVASARASSLQRATLAAHCVLHNGGKQSQKKPICFPEGIASSQRPTNNMCPGDFRNFKNFESLFRCYFPVKYRPAVCTNLAMTSEGGGLMPENYNEIFLDQL